MRRHEVILMQSLSSWDKTLEVTLYLERAVTSSLKVITPATAANLSLNSYPWPYVPLSVAISFFNKTKRSVFWYKWIPHRYTERQYKRLSGSQFILTGASWLQLSVGILSESCGTGDRIESLIKFEISFKKPCKMQKSLHWRMKNATECHRHGPLTLQISNELLSSGLSSAKRSVLKVTEGSTDGHEKIGVQPEGKNDLLHRTRKLS